MPRLFFDLFRKSPFGPLHTHMQKIHECIALMKPLFEAVLERQGEEKIQALVKDISRIEHEADIIKNEVRQMLPSSIFLPVNREDLLAYLKVQDDIADSIEDVSVLLTLKDLKVADSLKPDIYALIDKVLEVFQYCEEAEKEFEATLAAAFGEAEKRRLLSVVQKAEHAEWEADKLQHKAAKKLLTLEAEMSTLDIFMLFRVLGEVGRVANHAEKTGDRLRRLMVKG